MFPLVLSLFYLLSSSATDPEYIAHVSTLVGGSGSAGSKNGIGTNSQFAWPQQVTISPDTLYALICDKNNNLIRKVVTTTASATTLAGIAGSPGSANGMGTSAKFNYPCGVSISPDGVYALVSEIRNHLIRKIIISTANVSTLGGLAGSSGSTNGIGTNSG
jgi:DNA-binding beta-propeller fold protein YncE